MENDQDRRAHENGARLVMRVDIADELRAIMAEIQAEYDTGIPAPLRLPDDTEGGVRLRRIIALQSAIISVQAAHDREIPF